MDAEKYGREGSALVAMREGASDWRHKLAAFVTEIQHGDDRHKEWLWNAAHAFVAGDPVPKPDSAPIPSNEELAALSLVSVGTSPT